MLRRSRCSRCFARRDNRRGRSDACVASTMGAVMTGIPSVFDLRTINGSNGFTISGSGYYELAGSSVASAGDINGDGFADVIVGAPGKALGWYTDYAAYVIFGRANEDTPGASRIATESLRPPEGFRIIL